jgi:hypothetical protein
MSSTPAGSSSSSSSSSSAADGADAKSAKDGGKEKEKRPRPVSHASQASILSAASASAQNEEGRSSAKAGGAADNKQWKRESMVEPLGTAPSSKVSCILVSLFFLFLLFFVLPERNLRDATFVRGHVVLSFFAVLSSVCAEEVIPILSSISLSVCICVQDHVTVALRSIVGLAFLRLVSTIGSTFNFISPSLSFFFLLQRPGTSFCLVVPSTNDVGVLRSLCRNDVMQLVISRTIVVSIHFLHRQCVLHV